jgi:hypothetical protein
MLEDQVALDTDEEDEQQPDEPRWTLPSQDTVAVVVRIATFAIFAVVFAAAVVGNWLRAQNVDPQYAYDMVLRAARFGGTYYDNAIHNKGPLETFTYDVARWASSHNSFWYVISLFIALSALIIGIAAARTAQSFGANVDVAVAAAAVVFVHFTLSPSDYAGVLYARNMTMPLLCVAWVLVLWTGAWRNRRRSMLTAAAVGALLGIAVQTLVSTAFAATAIGLVFLVSARVRRPRKDQTRIDIAFFGAGAIAFLSAPVWYFLRGSFDEFFSGWWTYARFMNEGTGRSLGSQFALGWDQFYAYYQQRPLACVAVLAFAAMVALDWSSATVRERAVGLGLLGWFAGAWIELALAQRYSSHYFSVTSVPTALMVAALAGRVYGALAARRQPLYTFAWPLVALVLVVYLSGTNTFVDGMKSLSTFTSVDANARERESAQGGDIRSARAVLDLVSKDWDPLLVWTNDPWPYLDYRRTSATRFIWKAFLTGEIYLGRTSPEYVLPESWEWFKDDLEESRPPAYLKSNGGDVAPQFQKYVDDNFRLVYPDEPVPIYYRNDVADQILSPDAPNEWTPPVVPDPNLGWTADGNTARFRDKGGRDQPEARLPIASDSCFVLRGTADSDGPAGGIVFHFDDNAEGDKADAVNLVFDGDQVSSGSPATEYRRQSSTVTAPGSEPTEFTLIVNRRAAAIVVEGQIRAAVRLPESASVSLESKRSILNLRDLHVGPAPDITGCGQG